MGSSKQRAAPTGGAAGEDGGGEAGASAIVWTGDVLSQSTGWHWGMVEGGRCIVDLGRKINKT